MQVRILPPLPWIFREADAAERALDLVAKTYSFLLGIYLGDGHIVAHKKTYRLQIYLHARNRKLIDRVVLAMKTLVPDRSVTLIPHDGAIAVSSYFVGWPWLFPQHGAGRKHTRPIVLAPWQEEIVAWYPAEFARGCVESDGSRHRRVVNGKNYPAYNFVNMSEDILRLFTSACDRLGIRWRRASRTTISIARRADVARLDALFEYREPS